MLKSKSNRQTLRVVKQSDAVLAPCVEQHLAAMPGGAFPLYDTLGECATQSNLNDQGREQAVNIGAALKQEGFTFDKVLSSEWCRYKETALLLSLGDVQLFLG